MMATILEVSGVQNYLNDLVVYGATAEEQYQTLQSVLRKLKEAGLVLSNEKRHFIKTTWRFLGHVITVDGILPDQRQL